MKRKNMECLVLCIIPFYIHVLHSRSTFICRKQRGRVGFDRHGPEGFCAKSLEGGLYAVHDIVSGTETGDSICSG